MNNTYTSLVNQTFHFPQEGFEVDDNGYLQFNGVDLKEIIEKHGTPLKLTYLPKIGQEMTRLIIVCFVKIVLHSLTGVITVGVVVRFVVNYVRGKDLI